MGGQCPYLDLSTCSVHIETCAFDTSNLPSHRGNKRVRVDSSTMSKTFVVILDLTAPPVVSKVDTSLPLPDIEPFNSSPKAPPLIDGPMTLLRSEKLDCNRFKQVVRNEDVSICYDIFVKEFEPSTVLIFSR